MSSNTYYEYNTGKLTCATETDALELAWAFGACGRFLLALEPLIVLALPDCIAADSFEDGAA